MGIESHNFNFSHLPYMIIIPHNFKIFLSRLWIFHLTISKFYQPFTWNLFGLVIPVNSFLKKGRNYVSIVTTFVTNITVSHNVVFFGYFKPMSYDIIYKTPPSASPNLPPLPGFHRIFWLFYNKYCTNLYLL